MVTPPTPTPKDWTTGAVHDQVLLPIPKEQKKHAYSKWSTTYDEEAIASNYTGPQNTIDRLLPSIRKRLSSTSSPSTKLRVLDVGCGTGLCGVYFDKVTSDFRNSIHLIGVDYSDEMRAHARKTGTYDELVQADFDFPVTLQGGKVDFLVATGVFCEAHCPIRDLVNVIHALNVGGLASITVRRKSYVAEEREYCKYIEMSGCRVIDNSVMPYTNHGNVEANYLLLEKVRETILEV